MHSLTVSAGGLASVVTDHQIAWARLLDLQTASGLLALRVVVLELVNLHDVSFVGCSGKIPNFNQFMNLVIVGLTSSLGPSNSTKSRLASQSRPDVIIPLYPSKNIFKRYSSLSDGSSMSLSRSITIRACNMSSFVGWGQLLCRTYPGPSNSDALRFFS